MLTIRKNKLMGALMGMAVGDALGVPVEFTSRAARVADPVKEMREFGTWNQKKGTWSDDTSMALCLAESLVENGFDEEDQGKRYAMWRTKNHWTPHGRVFDIGGACSRGISNFIAGQRPSGCTHERDNGNGSLMRTMPLSIWLAHQGPSVEDVYDLAGRASGVTHGHDRSRLGCAIHAFFVQRILGGDSPLEAQVWAGDDVISLITANPELMPEAEKYHAALWPTLGGQQSPGCPGDGYVVHCLQASLWAVLSSSSYEEAVLKAVNLGCDTDTTACVTGGLAGLIWGLDSIPERWLDVLARRDDIEELFTRLVERL